MEAGAHMLPLYCLNGIFFPCGLFGIAFLRPGYSHFCNSWTLGKCAKKIIPQDFTYEVPIKEGAAACEWSYYRPLYVLL